MRSSVFEEMRSTWPLLFLFETIIEEVYLMDVLRMLALVFMLIILFCWAIFMVCAVVVFFKTVIEDYLWEREYRKERKRRDEQGW